MTNVTTAVCSGEASFKPEVVVVFNALQNNGNDNHHQNGDHKQQTSLILHKDIFRASSKAQQKTYVYDQRGFKRAPHSLKRYTQDDRSSDEIDPDADSNKDCGCSEM